MRVVCCLCLLLSACASHAVRCDGRLQPINPPPAGAVPGGPATGPAGAPGLATPRSVP